MSPSGPIGAIARSFPGNQERLKTVLSRLLTDFFIRFLFCLFSGGEETKVDLMTVSAPGGPQSLPFFFQEGFECEVMSTSTPDTALLLASSADQVDYHWGELSSSVSSSEIIIIISW